jgi:pimeloyl-ACP methyl ester carboxylesterase
MTDMPPLQFAPTNGIRMGYYDAGPRDAALPLVLCHGWPELAFSWRHQLEALAAAGLRVIAPDQRGFGATDRPEAVQDYDIEHLTADLVGLLDHLRIEQAVFVGHDWGGFVVWQMALRHRQRVAGVVGVNTPHHARAPVDPIRILRKRHGEQMYIVQFQQPGRDVDAIFDGRVAQTFDCFMRKPLVPKRHAPAGHGEPGPAAVAGLGAASTTNLAFPQTVAAYDPARDRREPILTPAEMQVFVDTYTRTGFSGGIHWYRNMTRNWERSAGLDHTVRVPALMIMAEHDAVLPPSAADGMEAIVPDLEKLLIEGSGHWTQQEKPAEVSRALIDWYRRRFGGPEAGRSA